MDPFTIALILTAISVAIAFLLPIPEIDAGNKPGLDAFQRPTADKSRPVNVIYGTVLIKGSNTIYFGELREETIYSS